MIEPYGYVWTSLKDCMETRFSHIYPNKFYNPTDIIPVYTHPMRELSDEEIMIIHDATNTNNWVIDFARAIIKASQGNK